MATALTAALGWSAGVGLEQVGVQTGGAVLGGANDVRSADAGGAGGVRDVGADAGGTSSVDGLRTPALPPHVQAIRARMLGGEVRACGAGEVRDVGAGRDGGGTGEVRDVGAVRDGGGAIDTSVGNVPQAQALIDAATKAVSAANAVQAAGVGEVQPASEGREREAGAVQVPVAPAMVPAITSRPMIQLNGMSNVCPLPKEAHILIEVRNLREAKEVADKLMRCAELQIANGIGDFATLYPAEWLQTMCDDPELKHRLCNSIDEIETTEWIMDDTSLSTYRPVTLKILAQPVPVIDGVRLSRVVPAVCITGICECTRG